MTMAPSPEMVDPLKVLISYRRRDRIKVVLIDSHGYSTQTGIHAISLAVVIYALRLGGQHRKMPATQPCIH